MANDTIDNNLQQSIESETVFSLFFGN